MAGKRKTEINEEGRVCTKCLIPKPWSDFAKSRKGTYGHTSNCKKCQGEHGAQYGRSHPGQKRKTWLSSKYGITFEEYETLWQAQRGLCAICGKPETQVDRHSRQVRHLAVDHDHETGKVRGLLCSACNTAIGLLDDNSETLRAGADYLEAAKGR